MAVRAAAARVAERAEERAEEMWVGLVAWLAGTWLAAKEMHRIIDASKCNQMHQILNAL